MRIKLFSLLSCYYDFQNALFIDSTIRSIGKIESYFIANQRGKTSECVFSKEIYVWLREKLNI